MGDSDILVCCMKTVRAWWFLWLLPATMLGVLRRAEALIIQGADDVSYNTTAPGGGYVDSGWQYQGAYGGGLGTVISPTQFITAAHLGVVSSFVYDSVIYTVDTVNVEVIAGTDLMILQVTDGVFGQYAALYDGDLTVGMELVSMGRGAARGNEFLVGGSAVGWVSGAGYGTQRWGVNELDDVVEYGEAMYLVAGFDAAGGVNEFGFTGGDSGGGVFVYDVVDDRWELAGVNYAVSGPYRVDPLVAEAVYGAFYDTGDLYESDGVDWVLSESGVSLNYMSSVTSNLSAVNAVLVPEPGSGVAVMFGALWLIFGLTRRRGVG